MKIKIKYTYRPEQYDLNQHFIATGEVLCTKAAAALIDTDHLGVEGRKILVGIAQASGVELFGNTLTVPTFDLGQLVAEFSPAYLFWLLAEKSGFNVSDELIRSLYEQYCS